MGMFDTVNCRFKMPDGIIGGEFQTKCLDCNLNTYEIQKDGRLVRTEEMREHSGPNMVVEDFSGEIEIYDSIPPTVVIGRNDNNPITWIQYDLVFERGMLKTISPAYQDEVYEFPDGLSEIHEHYDDEPDVEEALQECYRLVVHKGDVQAFIAEHTELKYRNPLLVLQALILYSRHPGVLKYQSMNFDDDFEARSLAYDAKKDVLNDIFPRAERVILTTIEEAECLTQKTQPALTHS